MVEFTKTPATHCMLGIMMNDDTLFKELPDNELDNRNHPLASLHGSLAVIWCADGKNLGTDTFSADITMNINKNAPRNKNKLFRCVYKEHIDDQTWLILNPTGNNGETGQITC